MEYEIQNNGNRVYTDANKKYTFVDMGEYIGYSSREFYEEVDPCWKLMFYEDGNINMEALVDTTGEYSRLMVSKDNIKRILLISGKYVLDDKVFAMDKDDIIPEQIAVAYKKEETTNIDLDTYLKMNKPFIQDDGTSYTSDVTSNQSIIDYIAVDKKLGPTITDETSKTR